MKHPDRWFVPQAGSNPLRHHLKVTGQLSIVVSHRVRGWIPAVVAVIEQHHVKLPEEVAPEGIIAVDSKAVAMTQEQPYWLRRVPMLPETGYGAIFQREVENSLWRRKRKSHAVAAQASEIETIHYQW